MNLQLIKIKKHNAFDYNLLSEFMIKKNGKLIFNAGFGNTGSGGGDSNKKEQINLMQKFERKFQMQSILKSYNEAFHIRPSLSALNNLNPKNYKNTFSSFTLPKLNKGSENLRNTHYKNRTKNYIRLKKNPNINFDRKNTIISLKHNYDKDTFDINDENIVDYNSYFYHTLDSYPLGTSSENYENDYYSKINNSSANNNLHTENKNKKLIKNISEDCIYLFGKNKIILKDKKEKNNNRNFLRKNYEISKTPFIEYDFDFNLKKTRNKLRKNYKFFGNNKIYNFTELKKEYIYKVRRMLENKTNIDYQFKSLPSHYSVKNIKRKKKSELI